MDRNRLHDRQFSVDKSAAGLRRKRDLFSTSKRGLMVIGAAYIRVEDDMGTGML